VAESLLIMDDLNADFSCLLAAVLYRRLVGGEDGQDLINQDQFGESAKLVQELLEIDRLELAFEPGSEKYKAEGLRRLVLALVKDVRVVLVVLSDRLVQMRHLAQSAEQARNELARRVQAIHIPLANRLGIWQLKWELEDLVFRYLQQDLYLRVASLLHERRADRERYINDLVTTLKHELERTGLIAEVKGRPKHIFSIWRKMQKKGLAFNQLYDLRAVRVLVDDVTACYSSLGLVHTLWQPIPGEFDDYIANPKGNMYQSLHTAVFGPGGKPIEIQIRTHEMHAHAELGVAAHWRYKEGGSHDSGFQRKLNWMRQVLESQVDGEDESLLDDFAPESANERVYALTPKGEVIDIKSGSTVLDFAYHVHTDVGHRCRGAKVNGRIVPFTYQVSNGDQVEILTGKHPEPSRDWLVSRLGYLHSPRSRSKVKQWFKRQDYDRNKADGREIVERELKRLAATAEYLERIIERFKQPSVDGLYVAVATGEISVAQIASALEELKRPEDNNILPLIPAAPVKTSSPSGDIVIEGVGNLLTVLAKCCQPVRGDRISGFITKVRGVSIHRADCKNLDLLAKTDPARVLEVSWGEQSRGGHYKVKLIVKAYDRSGLVRDIGTMLVNCHSDLIAINSQIDSRSGRVEVKLDVIVNDFDHLSYLLARLTSLPNVYDAKRVG